MLWRIIAGSGIMKSTRDRPWSGWSRKSSGPSNLARKRLQSSVTCSDPEITG